MHPLSASSFAQQTSPVLTVTCARCLLTDGYYGFKMDLFAAGGFGLKPKLQALLVPIFCLSGIWLKHVRNL